MVGQNQSQPLIFDRNDDSISFEYEVSNSFEISGYNQLELDRLKKVVEWPAEAKKFLEQTSC